MTSVKQEYEDYLALAETAGEDVSISNVIFDENSNHSQPRPSHDLGIDAIYTVQHQFGLGWLVSLIKKEPEAFPHRGEPGKFTCIDVGSQIEFVANMATFTNFVIVDPSLNLPEEGVSLPDLGIALNAKEGQDLSFLESSSMCVISSFHAIEHFGLGRYGDTLDPTGDVSAMREFNRVLVNGGFFMGSVPITLSGYERVEFNKQRVYSVKRIQEMLRDAGFDVVKSVCAVSTELIQKTLKNYGGHREFTFPASVVTPQDYEDSMRQFVDTDGDIFIEKNGAGHAAYIFLAQKQSATTSPDIDELNSHMAF